MPRMGLETQRELGLTDSQVDFDEMLQLDESDPRHRELKKKLGAKKISKKALERLKNVR